jgi:molybdopterin synthase catalytic subunit
MKLKCLPKAVRWRFFLLLQVDDLTSHRVLIQTEDFDLSEEARLIRSALAGVGAVCAFVGTVRDHNLGDAVTSLELEHYPGMTEASIEAMIDQAIERFHILAARVIHRVGKLLPQDQIVLVMVAAEHRGQSFQACEFLMDYLKTQAPFWKKENMLHGDRWVDARVSDDQAFEKWDLKISNTQ